MTCPFPRAVTHSGPATVRGSLQSAELENARNDLKTRAERIGQNDPSLVPALNSLARMLIEAGGESNGDEAVQ